MSAAAHTPGPWVANLNRDGAFEILDMPDCWEAAVLASRNPWERKAEECHANARLMAAAPCLLAEIEREYTDLADFHNNWPGRSTAEGQMKLCRLRDLIAVATGRSERDVQDDYGMRKAIAKAAGVEA